MKASSIQLHGKDVDVHVYDAIVVGTGCAGLNAADRLWHYGRRDIAIVTDHRKGGVSRNTGSDKQTYYKLTLSGDEPDSVQQMAQTFFEGQCVDGEHALCEAALSAKCFLRLCDLGVPFPTISYVDYIGYKTDHDPKRIATSAGPLTSRLMTEALEASVVKKDIDFLDHRQVIAILTDNEGRASGVMCLQTDRMCFELILAGYVIYATGGPGGIYQDSCYPLGHDGMSGAAFEAGAAGKNLTEWQYGLASIKPRWNVSGTYMQALPRFVSTDRAGEDEREFLSDYLPDAGDLLTKVFLKGYQWPFDTRKALHGSSVIDLIVYTETKIKGRRVFLDYRQNPLAEGFCFDLLGQEAYAYLQQANALFGRPIDRLRHMNEPAVAFYQSRGVDLETEMLEIALCSQHNNGGVAVDAWWRSTIPNLFVVGEAAATHGVYRPGGSALNAGQVGSERAARFIAKQPVRYIVPSEVIHASRERISRLMRLADEAQTGSGDLRAAYLKSIAAMSRDGAAVRSGPAIQSSYQTAMEQLEQFGQRIHIASLKELPLFFRYRDLLVTQCMYLYAMMDYIQKGGKSRGGALYTHAAGQKALPCLPEVCRMLEDSGELAAQVQEVHWRSGHPCCIWRKVHPLPKEDAFFENVWRNYRANENIY